MTSSEREQSLERVRFFADFSDTERRRLAASATVVQFAAGALICREGEIGDCAYVVVQGSAQVFTHDKSGQELTLDRHGPLVLFGEQSLLPGRSNRRNASVRATPDGAVTLLRIQKEDFQNALSEQRHLRDLLAQVGEEQVRQRAMRTRALVRLWALFVFVNGFLTTAILGGVAILSQTPFVFPSLGPTAFLLFFTPTTPAASPRNVLCGHAVGVLCGYGALWVTGLQDAGPATMTALDGWRVLAAALSLAATGGLMILLDVPHPPAAATTLIVSLGVVTRPWYLAVILLAVALLTLQALVINRLAGVKYPLWAR
jgi:CRP-like cAMP-binding protein